MVGDLARLTAGASANGCDVIASLPKPGPEHPIRSPFVLMKRLGQHVVLSLPRYHYVVTRSRPYPFDFTGPIEPPDSQVR